MATDIAMAWCQDCKKWVPANKMNYFDGFRVCTWCMEGTEQPDGLVYDPHREEVQCIYCDSYNTQGQVPNWGTFKCLDCNEIFRRL